MRRDLLEMQEVLGLAHSCEKILKNLRLSIEESVDKLTQIEFSTEPRYVGTLLNSDISVCPDCNCTGITLCQGIINKEHVSYVWCPQCLYKGANYKRAYEAIKDHETTILRLTKG